VEVHRASADSYAGNLLPSRTSRYLIAPCVRQRKGKRTYALSTPSHLDICHQSLLSAEVIPSGCFAGTINDDKIRKSAQVRDKYLSVRFNEKKFKRHVANQATDFTRLLFTNIQMADKKEF